MPNYEKVLEHTIDLGFLTALTTNGTKLEKLINNVSVAKIKKMAWIGIDIDAGEEELYEKIRRSLTKKSPFNKVMQNAKELVKLGANVDFKIFGNGVSINTVHALCLVQYLSVQSVYTCSAVFTVVYSYLAPG